MTLQWHSYLNPLICGLIILAAGWGFREWYRRLALKLTPARALALMAPRLLIAALLALALFDPTWRRETHELVAGKILALLDTSSSMDVRDDNLDSRRARATALLERISKGLPRGVSLETMEFDEALRLPSATNRSAGTGPRATDLGACLLALSERGDISSYLGVIMLTDGGDTPTLNIRLPPVPLSLIGIGADPTNWNDVAIAGVQAPVTAEEAVEFEINADLQARTGGAPQFAAKLAKLEAVLENENAGQWTRLMERRVDLSRQRAQVSFRTACPAGGSRRYRIAIAPVEGELTTLNNTRTFTIAVQKKGIRVLYFSRELGADFKLIRSELERDPGISFTALFRTLSERFTIQGDRLPGDDDIQAGFPTSEKALARYDCLMLGSFPADAWTSNQVQALAGYIENGGACVLLGGPDTFGPRAYAATPLAPLFPWQISRSLPDIITGSFPVSIPLSASGHPIVAGLDLRLKEEAHPTLDSVIQPGPLKPGAISLLDAQYGQQVIPVIAFQPFGKGKVLGLASNTLWKWARRSQALHDAYGIFWRQAIRHLAGQVDKGRLIEVRWDRDAYNPGEEALANIRVEAPDAGRASRLAAALSENGDPTPLMVDPVPGRADAFSVKMRFKRRGEAQFQLTLSDGTQFLETYTKTLNVAPLLDEGAHLEINADFLRALAERGSGLYAPEKEIDPLLRYLQDQVSRTTRVTETALCQAGPWFALLIIALLALEWLMRRKRNLI